MLSIFRCVMVAVLAAPALLVPTLAEAQSAPDESSTPASRVLITGELGFLDPLAHTVQFSSDGTEFDYVEDGGQDNLYQFARLSAEFDFRDTHKFIFLYQPLEIQTDVVLRDELRVDDLTFPEGTPVQLRYGFPFYRLGYLYDFFEGADRELAIGAALQLRNATIDFKSADGELFRSNRDVGPVPLLKLRTRLPLAGAFWWGFEATGFYAPVKYLNGGDSDVEGAILDTSLRVGRPVTDHIDAFFNLRYLAGGGEGTSKDDNDLGDGYVSNWLHFATVSLGFTFGTEMPN
jgi:hypothetical protein